MAKYEPFGPFEVPRKNGIVDTSQIKKGSEFWEGIEAYQKGLSTAHGCYIFSIRAGRGIRPWYVGQAKGKNGFLQEVLSDNKLKHYNDVIAAQRGTPILQFLARVTDGGKLSKSKDQREIDYMETILIGMAYYENTDLKNTKVAKSAGKLIIPGITGGEGKGRPSEAIQVLKTTLGH